MDDVRVRTSTSSDTSSSSTSRREFCAWLCVHACSHAGLAALVVAYTLLGAVLFELVEGGGHAATAPSSRSSSAAVTSSVASGGGDRRGAVTAVQKSREECLRELWTITERLNVLYERNWTRLVHEQLRKFELNVMAATQLGGGPGSLQDLQDTTMGHPQQWSFGGALLYSVTVITTIGYGNLSPRTSLGKILTMIYALFGVPLMLLCLSSLGQALAKGVHYVYMRVTCQQINNTSSHPAGRSEGHSHSSCKRMTAGSSRDRRQDYKYQMVTNSPARSSCASTHDSSVIQITTPHKSLSPPPPPQLTPRKSALATVNSSHTRPRCRLLSTPLPPSAHASDAEDLDETDDTESGNFVVHDTPSRIPLIWREDSKEPSTPSHDHSQHQPVSVPVAIVLILLTAYLCLGAFTFATWENWSYLDATYFCFITLCTIGFGDLIPGQTFPSAAEYGHLQLVLCSVYLVIGLILVAMSFSLIHDEVVGKCKQVARALGLHTH